MTPPKGEYSYCHPSSGWNVAPAAIEEFHESLGTVKPFRIDLGVDAQFVCVEQVILAVKFKAAAPAGHVRRLLVFFVAFDADVHYF